MTEAIQIVCVAVLAFPGLSAKADEFGAGDDENEGQSLLHIS